MTPRILVACIIFAGSYLPLSLILLAQNFDYDHWHNPPGAGWGVPYFGWAVPLKNPGFAIGIFLTCLICFVVTLTTLASVPTKAEIIVRQAEHAPADLMNYVLPYVVSFMSIDYQNAGKFVGFVIFLTWMFWITYKSGHIILNPVLTVFGWKLYKIVYSFPGDQREYSGIALTKIIPLPGMRYRLGSIQDVSVLQ